MSSWKLEGKAEAQQRGAAVILTLISGYLMLPLLFWLYILCLISLASFKLFLLSMDLCDLITMYLGTIFFIFLVLGCHWTSYICGFIIVSNLENFLPLFLQICSLSLPSRTSTTSVLNHLKLYHSFLMLCSFFFWFFFLSVIHFG